MQVTAIDLFFTYPGGAEALRGVSLAIQSGESVAIIGENGAGKTTLVKHFNGLLRPAQGSVVVGDWNTQEYTVAQMAARVGFLFQNPDDQLVERTVRDEVAFGPEHLGQSEEAIETNVSAALALVGLTAEADTNPYDLMASQRKMVALASVLAMQTPVLILDEPTLGQDATGVALAGRIVQGLQSEGRTVITITHDIDFCSDYFGRVVVMGDGQILADGPAGDILSRTALLAGTNVDPPQLVRLAQGLALRESPLTVDGFVEVLRAERER